MSVCKKEIFYLNCKGECESYFIDIVPPYIHEHPIYAPVFESTTWGSSPFLHSEIVKGLYIENNKYYIHLKYPISVGALVQLGRWSNEYFLKKKLLKRNKLGNFVYEIQRIGSNFLTIDFEVLKRGNKLKVKGFKR